MLTWTGSFLHHSGHHQVSSYSLILNHSLSSHKVNYLVIWEPTPPFSHPFILFPSRHWPFSHLPDGLEFLSQEFLELCWNDTGVVWGFRSSFVLSHCTQGEKNFWKENHLLFAYSQLCHSMPSSSQNNVNFRVQSFTMKMRKLRPRDLPKGCQTFRVISRVALMINRAAGVWRRWISMYLGIASDPKCNCNYTGWVSGTQGKGSEWPGLLSGLFYHNRSRGWPPRLLGLEKVLGGPALGHQAGLSLNSGTVTLFP